MSRYSAVQRGFCRDTENCPGQLFIGDKYSLENIYKEIFKEGVIGLLSSGLVYNNGSEIEIISLSNSKQIPLKYKEYDDSNLNIAAEP